KFDVIILPTLTKWRQKMKRENLTVTVILLLTVLILTSCGVSQKQVDVIADQLIESQKALENCKGETDSILQFIGDADGITTMPREDEPEVTLVTYYYDQEGRPIRPLELFKMAQMRGQTVRQLVIHGVIIEKVYEIKLNPQPYTTIAELNQKKYDEQLEAARKEYEEKYAATEHEWEAAFRRYKLDLQNVSYYLSYEFVESAWLAGNIEGEEAIAKMEKQLVRLGDDELLSLWKAFLAAETEQERTDKALEFNNAYYREIIALMDSLVEKYGLMRLGY
ncbi:hypothetical protein ACFLV3_06680, partial [Chloroflexota bacterium]